MHAHRRPLPATLLATLVALMVLAVLPGPLRAQDAPTRQLLAGAATSNITPALGGLIVGNWTPTPATHVHDELHARCLVLDDGVRRVALVVVDSLGVPRHVLDHAKRLAHEHTGIAPDHILISATHTHSATSSLGARWSPAEYEVAPALDEYQAFLATRIADGIRRAVANLAPARIGWARGALPDEVFNRRWFMKPGPHLASPFGGMDQVQMNPRVGSPDLIEPAGPTDPEVSVVAVRTPDGRPIAVLANYSLHYVGGVPQGHVSADYFGVFAHVLARMMGEDRRDSSFVAMLSNGTSGDINNIDVRGGQPSLPPYARMERVASRLAAEVFQSLQHVTWHDWAPLGMRQRTMTLETRRPTPDLVAWAREVMARPEDAAPRHPRERIYAERTLGRADVPPTLDVVLQALRVGDVAITSMPFEVFAEIGLQIRERSPFAQSFTVSLANGSEGYLPTARHHALGGYETWLGTNRVEPDAAEKMTDALLEMLRELAAVR
jgi:neutral ceramidase